MKTVSDHTIPQIVLKEKIKSHSACLIRVNSDEPDSAFLTDSL